MIRSTSRRVLRAAVSAPASRGGLARRAPPASGASRAFSSDASTPSPSPPSDKKNGKKTERHWSGINTYYFSMRGLGIATRVVSNMQDFFRFYDNDVFAKQINDDARSAMYVLTQFPVETRVDLLEFRRAAEQLVHTVYEQMYATAGSAKWQQGAAPSSESAGDSAATSESVSIEDPLWYLSSIASDECADILKTKASEQAKRIARNGEPRHTRVVLEQLNVDRVAIAAVDYKSSRYSDEEAQERGYEEEEWLEIQVQYDVTEHLTTTTVSGEGIDDRKTINTTFAWTFESNVTDPEQVEWQIIDATPFTETSALLTASVKAKGDASEQ